MLARADLLNFLKKDCEERGATIIYATHIFDGLENWPSHIVSNILSVMLKLKLELYGLSKYFKAFLFQVYVAHGKLQLAMPMDEVKKLSNLSLMVSFLSVDLMLDFFGNLCHMFALILT